MINERLNIMRNTSLIVAAAALFTVPALADNHTSDGQEDQMSQSQDQMSQNQSGSQGQMSQEQMQQRQVSQEEVRSAMEQAGFTEVRILDTAYLVGAMTQQGESVVMVINPDGGMMGGQGMDGQMQQSQQGGQDDMTGESDGTDGGASSN